MLPSDRLRKYRSASIFLAVWLSLQLSVVDASEFTVSSNGVLQQQFEVDTALGGQWRGNVISQMGSRYQILLHIEAFSNGECSVRYDVVDQRQFGRRMSTASCDRTKMLFADDSTGAVFEGRFNANENVIDGTWSQVRTRTPVRFRKVVPVVKIQETTNHGVGTHTELTIVNNETKETVVGILSIPDAQKPAPVVILINDRGIPDRDATEPSGHKPFVVLSNVFVKQGWAALRLDDPTTPSLEEHIENVVAAIDSLAAIDQVDANNVFLFGHGEGGLMAAEVARQRPLNVQGIIFAATPAIDGKHWLVAQQHEIDRLQGVDEEVTAAAAQTIATWYDIVARTQDTDQRIRLIGMVADTMMKRHATLLGSYPLARTLAKPDRASTIERSVIPWIEYFVDASPDARIGRINKPALVLLAQNDSKVPPQYNEPAWDEIARSREHIQIEFVQGVNHSFQHCTLCTLEESMNSPETVAQEVLDVLVTWIRRRL